MGFASVTIEESIVLKGIRVIKSDTGYWLAYPAREVVIDDGTKEYYQHYHPITAEFRQELLDAVVQEIGVDQSNDDDSGDVPF